MQKTKLWLKANTNIEMKFLKIQITQENTVKRNKNLFSKALKIKILGSKFNKMYKTYTLEITKHFEGN